MEQSNSTILINKYILSTSVISLAVAILIHFPESASLFHQGGDNALFPGIRFIDVLNEVLFTFVSLLIMFAINTQVFHFNRFNRIGWKKITYSFILMWGLSNLLGKTFVFLHQSLDIPAIDAMLHHYLHPLRDFIMSCLVTSSCYIIHLVGKQQQVLVENQQLRAESILNQYEALKNQLNPHMLFNSLNTLQSLIREDQNRAQKYIQELSRVFRYTLQVNELRSVTLREEMNFISAYLFLLKMRFEENLEVIIDIDENVETHLLPPMSIQVLIENAVKHNEVSNRHPLVIRIETDGNEYIKVSNPLRPKRTATWGTGIGLINLGKRYQLLFHRDILVTEDTHFNVRLPLIREQP